MSDEPMNEAGAERGFRKSAVIFGFLAALPFVETLAYNAHVGSGRTSLSEVEYIELAVACLILIFLMMVIFLLQQGDAKKLLEPLMPKLDFARRTLSRQLALILLVVPILFLIVFFGGETGIKVLERTGLISKLVWPFIEMAFIVFLIWVIAKLLKVLSDQHESLKDALNEWAFSVKLSIAFYVILIASTFKFVDLNGIKEAARVGYSFGIAKDYFLLFIISTMLYGGLYKVSRARKLAELFRSDRGFLHFVIVCGVIAILAIWADFNGMRPDIQELLFIQDWQTQYNLRHVYVRDIGLLLLPIAALLFWCLNRLGDELDKGKNRDRAENTS